MSDYTFLQLNSSTIFYLEQLYKEVYRKRLPANYFRLKYNTEYVGKQPIGFFALKDKLPVAFYGIIPTIVSVRNSTVLAAQSCDTMTHPGYRKKGLFVKLAEMTFELAKKNAIHFVFGFPNLNSHKIFVNQLGFKEIEIMNRYTIRFKESFFNKIVRKIYYLNQKDSVFFENNLLQQGFDGVVYDQAFFKYKKYNQNLVISLENNLYWINKFGNLFVGAVRDEDQISISKQIALLRAVTRAASISFVIGTGTKLDHVLSQVYKAEEGFPVIVKDLSGKLLLDNLKFQLADIDIF